MRGDNARYREREAARALTRTRVQRLRERRHRPAVTEQATFPTRLPIDWSSLQAELQRSAARFHDGAHLVADAMAVVFEQWHAGRQVEDWRQYSFGVLRRTVRCERRRAQRVLSLDALPQPVAAEVVVDAEAAAATPDRPWSWPQGAGTLRCERRRAVLELCVRDGRTIAQIALALRCDEQLVARDVHCLRRRAGNVSAVRPDATGTG